MTTANRATDPGLAIAEFGSTGRAVTTGKPYEQTCISVVYTDDQGRRCRDSGRSARSYGSVRHRCWDSGRWGRSYGSVRDA